MATIVVDKFINLIGFDFTKQSKDAFASVEKGIKSLRKFALVSASALTGLGVAMERVAGSIDDQAKFARGIDVSFEKLQQLQFAAQKAGVSVADLNGFLEGLAKSSASTLPGQFNTALQQLGVTAKNLKGELKDPITLALELSDAINKVPEKLTQVEFGGRLGASVKLMNLLGEGTDKIVNDMNELREIRGIIPESLTQDVAEFFDDSLLKVNKTLKVLSETILVSFLPAVSNMLDKFDKWVVENENILSSGIAAFIEGVGQGFSDFGKFVQVAASAASSFFTVLGAGNMSLNETRIISKAVEGALVAVSLAFIASKAEAVLLGAILIRLSSIIGGIFENVDKLINIFGVEFPGATRVFREGIEALFNPLDTLINKLDKFVSIKDKFDKFSDILSKINPLKPISDLGGNINETFKTLGLDEKQKDAARRVSSLNNSRQSVAASGSSSTSNNTTSNNIVINVNGAGDPKAVAIEVNHQMGLAAASKISNPGFNRPPVS